MADKSFGVDQLDILGTGTPTISAPNQLNLDCNTVAISTSATVGQNLTVSANAGIASLNVTGIATVVNFNATGISTIASPSDTNSHSRWKVSNNGSSAYRFTGPGQDGSEDNPNVYLVRGQRYIFDVNASGHPFQLRVANGGAAYSDGVTNNGAQSGQVIFNVQHDAPAQLYYQCTNHGGMVGNIYVVGGPQVISGVLTATSFSGSGANLTSLPSQVTINNASANRVLTSDGGTTLNGEANLTFNSSLVVTDGNGTVTTGGNYINLKRTSGDTNYINAPLADAELHISADENIIFKTVHTGDFNSTERLRIDSTGTIKLYGDGGNNVKIYGHDGSDLSWILGQNNSDDVELNNFRSGNLLLKTNGSEKLRIASNGHVGINQSSPERQLHIVGNDGATGATLGNSDTCLVLDNQGTNGAIMEFLSDNNGAGRIQFTDTDGSNRGQIQYIHSSDTLALTSSGGNPGYELRSASQSFFNVVNSDVAIDKNNTGTIVNFIKSGNSVGTISISSSSTSFNTSSDYRLKENVVAITNAITRLKTLKPYRFNFKSDSKTTVDGFLAHEVTAVPEAVTGSKDQVATADDVTDQIKEGDPIYQSIDQSKLVPLLTAALQEQQEQIENLQAEVDALKAK